MIKQTNHLASQSERLKVRNALPKNLLKILQHQENLTKQLQEVLVLFVNAPSASHCQVVRYHQGKLVIATNLATLSNHLLAIKPLLIEALQTKPSFKTLSEITFV